MTVTTETVKVTAPGNGAATVFSGNPLKIFETSQLRVVRVVDATGAETDLVEGLGIEDYIVTLTNPDNLPTTFSIQYPADLDDGTILPTGQSLVIKQDIPNKQEVDLENQGGYFPETQEQMHDRVVFMVNQLQEAAQRAIKLAFSDASGIDVELPPIANVGADSVLGINTAKTAFEFKSGIGTLPDPVTIARGGTSAVTAAGARTNLGSTTVGDAVFIAADAAAARTALALGDIAVENSPLAVTKGGTGGATKDAGRQGLGFPAESGNAGKGVRYASGGDLEAFTLLAGAVETKTADYPVVVGDENKLLLADTSSTGSQLDFTLPAAATAGAGFKIGFKVIDATQIVRVTPAGVETIDGFDGVDLSTLRDTIWVVSDGSNWHLLARQIAAIRTVHSSTGANTHTFQKGRRWAVVEVIGAGGGGGGADSIASEAAASGGAGAGGRVASLLDIHGIASGTATVGVGGAAGAAGSNGSAGGGSSWSDGTNTLSGGGGGGGQAGASGAVIGPTGQPGAGGTASGGQENTVGSDGQWGLRLAANAGLGGFGGSSFFGNSSVGGRAFGSGSQAGSAGHAHGGGGGGAAGENNNDAAGGAGADGVVIVTEY